MLVYKARQSTGCDLFVQLRILSAFLAAKPTSGSCSAHCSSQLPGSSRQSCFPDSQFLLCLDAESLPSQGKVFGFVPLEFHNVFVNPFIPPGCVGPCGWQICPQAGLSCLRGDHTPPLPHQVWCYLQTCQCALHHLL